jgi:mycofactocin glycosyltransferase
MTMRTSIVIETWNLSREPEAAGAAIGTLLAKLTPASAAPEIIVTHEGIPSALRARHAGVRWVELPRKSGYYEHKNAGFAASVGKVVAFIDGDCTPAAGWLDAIVEPIVSGRARVVAGRTVYGGGAARALETTLDFPMFASRRAPSAVENFFANNVAFARDAFPGYPQIPEMFHGQCQVLALTLAASGVVVHHAAGARVEHAFPEGRREWLRIHLLRGADASRLAPHVVGSRAPRLAKLTRRAAPLPALAAIGARAVVATARPSTPGRSRRTAVATIAAVTIVEALGAIAERTVHRRLSPA